MQWKKRKQSKAESARIKKAKLDPDAIVSAADVRDKRVSESDEEGERENGDVDSGKGEEGGSSEDEDLLRRKRKTTVRTNKTKDRRQQQQENSSNIDMIENQPSYQPAESLIKTTEAEKKKPKRVKKTEEGKGEKDGKKGNRHGETEEAADSPVTPPGSCSDPKVNSIYATESSTPTSASPTLSNITAATTPPSSIPEPQPIVGSNTAVEEAKSGSILDMRARLAARIEALRAARKAIGTKPSDPNGPAPPRNRQELMEARAKKEALRKAKRVEARAKAKAAAAAAAAAAASIPPINGIVASSSRGTSVDGRVSPVPSISTNYSFGKVVFDDGEALDASLRGMASTKERKRANGGDTKALLEQVQRKKVRLEEMDEGKREKVEESERWGKAIAKVAGEKVKDDEKLLKKAMKRVEARKRKSEREWLVPLPSPVFPSYEGERSKSDSFVFFSCSLKVSELDGILYIHILIRMALDETGTSERNLSRKPKPPNKRNAKTTSRNVRNRRNWARQSRAKSQRRLNSPRRIKEKDPLLVDRALKAAWAPELGLLVVDKGAQGSKGNEMCSTNAQSAYLSIYTMLVWVGSSVEYMEESSGIRERRRWGGSTRARSKSQEPRAGCNSRLSRIYSTAFSFSFIFLPLFRHPPSSCETILPVWT